MIKHAALLASGEESNDAWYLMNLFRQTQPDELLRICCKTLSTFLDIPYDCLANAWPLQSRMEAPTNAAPSSSASRFVRQRSESRLAPKSKLPPLKDDCGLLAISVKKPQISRIGWFKQKCGLSSKPDFSMDPRSQNPDFTLSLYIIDFLLDNSGRLAKHLHTLLLLNFE